MPSWRHGLVGPFHSESLRKLAGRTSDGKHACSDFRLEEAGLRPIANRACIRFKLQPQQAELFNHRGLVRLALIRVRFEHRFEDYDR
jgi:hypothetical protein